MSPPSDDDAFDARRRFLKQSAALGSIAGLTSAPAATCAQTKEKQRVFRWAINFAETGFDPAQISDLASNTVVSHIFDSPLQYDYLARPAVIKPRTAVAMPETSADFRTFTLRIRPGIHFQDDPVFKGQRRELVAADYIYQMKRVADPRWKSPLWPSLESTQILGLSELRKAATDGGRFDYDSEIPGLRKLDRYTFQVRLAVPSPRFAEVFTDARVTAGVAREVVEAYTKEIMGKPIGTGPFRLASWTRASRIVLERNPTYRDEFYDAQPAKDDARGQEILKRLKGRKLPMVDRVELSIIDESQPRWLAFLNGQQDTVNVPLEFINVAVPNGKVAPALAKKGIELERVINPDVAITFFNMDDPVVGGYTPEKVALRRAISLGYNLEEEIRLIRRGSMMPAQSQVPPLTTGYDPNFFSEMSQFDRARARALLDTFGYLDRDGDGWRELPDGSPLTLEIATETSQLDRAFNELWKRQLDALNIRVAFKAAQWPENLRNARAGKLMMWLLGNTASSPDADAFLNFGNSKNIGAGNFARFKRPEYDQLYNLQKTMPDGPERNAVIREMKRMFVVWMPYKIHGHRFVNDVSHPWLIGYRRHPFGRDFFKWIDIDSELRERVTGKV
jgi:ABC-type transport system substrate-binding protein